MHFLKDITEVQSLFFGTGEKSVYGENSICLGRGKYENMGTHMLHKICSINARHCLIQFKGLHSLHYAHYS